MCMHIYFNFFLSNACLRNLRRRQSKSTEYVNAHGNCRFFGRNNIRISNAMIR